MTSELNTKDLPELVKKFLGDSFCAIMEPSGSFASNPQALLTDTGVPLSQIVLLRKYDEAKQFIQDKKPRLLLTEYSVPGGSGISLVELQEGLYCESEKAALIVTKNSSAQAVAEAAEGAVDSYLLKPFSADTFRRKLLDVLDRKLNPSLYSIKIQEGRDNLVIKEFEMALQGFGEAKSLHEQPTLAHFYSGFVLKSQKDLEVALAEFQKGRKFQPLHYKCLTGEFETLMDLKRYKDAYALVPLIRDNYPITSQRLGQIFIAAVFTYHFEDLPDLYDIFLATENRTPWLIELTSLALLTAARYWIQKKDMKKAMLYVDMGMTVRAKDMNYMEQAIDDFLKVGAAKEADQIFAKIPSTEVGSAKYCQLRLKVDCQTLTPEKALEEGRKLTKDGHGTPEIFRLMVKLSVKVGKTTLAESFIAQGVKQFPDLRKELYDLLSAG